MIGRTAITLFAIILLPLTGWASGGEGLQTVTSEGVGIVVDGDRATARDQAIGDALRNAVKEAVRTIVSPEKTSEISTTLNDTIYAQSDGYVQNYKILSENQTPNLHTVVIQAAIEMGILEKDLEVHGIIPRQASQQGILLLIAEKPIDKEKYSYWWGAQRGDETISMIAEKTILDQLSKNGFFLLDSKALGKRLQIPFYFQVPDLSDQEAIALGRQAGAEIVIVGSVTAKAMGPIGGTPMMSAQADMFLRAIQTETGKILSWAREQAAAFHVDEITAGSESIQKASTRIVKRLVQDINMNPSEKPALAGIVELTVHGLSGIEALRRFKKSLRDQIPGVKGIQEKSFSEKMVQMDVRIEGSARSWIDVLSRTSLKEFSLVTIRTSGNAIELIAAPRENFGKR